MTMSVERQSEKLQKETKREMEAVATETDIDFMNDLVSVTLSPGGAARSQVDQGEETRFPEIKLQNEPQCNI